MGADAKKVRILVIEDDLADLQLLRIALDEAGLDVILDHVADGEEAIHLLEKMNQRVKPGLVVLDLNLPKVKGDEVLRRIRRHPALKDVQVVVLTSSEAEQDRQRMKQLGANEYVTKGYDVDQFLQVGRLLKSMLHLRPGMCH